MKRTVKRADELFTSDDFPPIDEMQRVIENTHGKVCLCCKHWGWNGKCAKLHQFFDADAIACKRYRVESSKKELEGLYLSIAERNDNA